LVEPPRNCSLETALAAWALFVYWVSPKMSRAVVEN